jgi:HAD superfamily hydrolase (TIGR01549 family)
MKFQRNGRPGINETLQALRDKNIQIAVLSDYDCVKERLINLNIDPRHFSITTSCEASGALKPSPRPFLQIANSWGIAPSQLLVVGDRSDTDGAAAKRAGMDFVRISEQSSPAQGEMNWQNLKVHFEQLPDLSRIV